MDVKAVFNKLTFNFLLLWKLSIITVKIREGKERDYYKIPTTQYIVFSREHGDPNAHTHTEQHLEYR